MQAHTINDIFNIILKYHQILQEQNIKAAPDKSFFFLKEVKFLGKMIKKYEVRPLQKKIETFLNLQLPNSKEKISEFNGFLTFISKYIFNLHEMLRPLYLLLRNTVDFKWKPHLEQSLLDLKS